MTTQDCQRFPSMSTSSWTRPYPAREAAEPAAELSAWEAAVMRPGRSETKRVVKAASPAMTRRSVVKPAANAKRKVILQGVIGG